MSGEKDILTLDMSAVKVEDSDISNVTGVTATGCCIDLVASN